MIKLKRFTVLFLFIIAGITVSASAQEGISSAVKQNIQQRLKEGNIFGISIAYIEPDGNVLYYSAGFLSTEKEHPVTKNTIFEIGSVTKTVTSLILARMVLQHKVALNDPINKYLPDSLHVPSYQGQKITLEELATHTSGLPRMPSNVPLSTPNYYTHYTIHDMYEFLDHYKLTNKPGTHFLYSNLGVGLLGVILSNASGLTYAQLLHKYITGPLQMNVTKLRVPKTIQSRFADPYKYGKPVHHWIFLESFAGAGGIRSTATDLATYLKAQMGLIETPLDSAIALTHKIRFRMNKNRAIGLAWMISTVRDTIIWHNGETGGFYSFVGFNKDKRTGVVVLSSSRDPEISLIGMHLLDQPFPLPKVKRSIHLDPSVLKKYTGTYQFTPDFSITITRKGDQLFEQATGQQKFKIYPESKTKFFLKVVDAELEFVANQNGKFTTLKLYQNGRISVGKRIED